MTIRFCGAHSMRGTDEGGSAAPPSSRWKDHLIVLVLGVLGVSSAVFVISGYSALYQAWVRGDLTAAVPYLPWARGSGVLAVAGATAAFTAIEEIRRETARLDEEGA